MGGGAEKNYRACKAQKTASGVRLWGEEHDRTYDPPAPARSSPPPATHYPQLPASRVSRSDRAVRERIVRRPAPDAPSAGVAATAAAAAAAAHGARARRRAAGVPAAAGAAASAASTTATQTSASVSALASAASTACHAEQQPIRTGAGAAGGGGAPARRHRPGLRPPRLQRQLQRRQQQR